MGSDERIEWDSALDTGNELVDAQHRELVDMFNALLDVEDASQPEVLAVLDGLAVYTATHFSAEEGLMVSSRYGAARMASHVDEHEQLTQRVRELVLLYRSGELPSVRPLVRFLHAWLVEHVAKCDRELADHLAATR